MLELVNEYVLELVKGWVKQLVQELFLYFQSLKLSLGCSAEQYYQFLAVR